MNTRRTFLKQAALLGTTTTLPLHHLFAQGAGSAQPVGDGRFAEKYENIRRAKKPPRKITIPDAGEYKVIKGDFHMHTLFSDGHVMPRDRVLEAVDNGLDVIAITDHIEYRPNFGGSRLKLADKNDDYNISYSLAKAEAEQNNLILALGTEITKPARHFNALFLKDVNQIAAVVNDWRAMLAVAAEQGGFIQWNHPHRINQDPVKDPNGLSAGEPMRFFEEHEELWQKGHLHGVEVFNGASLFPIALEWCNERDLAPITISDIHPSEWNTYGHQNLLRPMTLVLANERSHDSIREAFLAKRTIGWAANMILGRQPWVEKLFRACVAIKKTGTALEITNRSDIPCYIEKDNETVELQLDASLTFSNAPKTLVVSNWFVGMKKPLEIDVE